MTDIVDRHVHFPSCHGEVMMPSGQGSVCFAKELCFYKLIKKIFLIFTASIEINRKRTANESSYTYSHEYGLVCLHLQTGSDGGGVNQ